MAGRGCMPVTASFGYFARIEATRYKKAINSPFPTTSLFLVSPYLAITKGIAKRSPRRLCTKK
jgi:hypothetical protein